MARNSAEPLVISFAEHTHEASFRARLVAFTLWWREVQHKRWLRAGVIEVVIVKFGLYAVLSVLWCRAVVCVQDVLQRIRSWWSVGDVGRFRADRVLAGVSDDPDVRGAGSFATSRRRDGTDGSGAFLTTWVMWWVLTYGWGAAIAWFPAAIVSFDFLKDWAGDVAWFPTASEL